MSEYKISYADLSMINGALRSIDTSLYKVDGELNNINLKQDQLESELDKLADAFHAFVEADIKHKALQLAETRVGNLRQELQIKYGYYAEIRRMATGILQGVDTGVVSDDTLRFTTEEVLIKAPGYWLAPALVAVASWIRNDKNACEKAVNEGLKRDDYKTTLFLMLVMRRLSRHEASLKWLERYFMHQNPKHLDREFIVILEAVTTGIFPPAARQLMMRNVKGWLDQLTSSDEFIAEQKRQWVNFFRAKGPLLDDQYPLLKKFTSNWDALATSLREAKTHAVLQSYFKSIFSSSYDFSKAMKVQLDEILSLLVTNFDDEELPLQRQVRLNQLIIEMEGDKKAAQALIDSEVHIFEENVDFLQLLTNAAFNPELSGATKVTQALAVSISQPWIVEGYDEFTAHCRNNVPASVDLSIDGWSAQTADGSDEAEQLRSQELYYDQLLQDQLAKLSFPYAGVVIGALIAVGGLYALYSALILVGIICLGIGGALVWSSLNNHKKAKQQIIDTTQERHQKAKEVLRGCLAETVDYRVEHATEDGKAEGLRHLLKSITAEDFSSVSKESARSIINA